MENKLTVKRVLIAHQSTIPHYRIPFFNSLECLKPDDWHFDVVFDLKEGNNGTPILEGIERTNFNFSILRVTTYDLWSRHRSIKYQTFWREAGKYDLIIVEDAINNLTYPLIQLHQYRGVKIAHWGLGRDRKVNKHNPVTLLIERFKLFLDRRADGYFAYTDGVKSNLLDMGLAEEKVFVVNNTIDVNMHRKLFISAITNRETIREELGLSDKKVLLFVSTFKKSKKADFLLDAFTHLRKLDPKYFLLLVGGGGDAYIKNYDLNRIKYFGPEVDPLRLAPIYIASDLFTYPGQVGLAPLQALCYSLPVITIDSNYLHGPEIEYLTPENSLILQQSTTPEGFARKIHELFCNKENLAFLKEQSWPSIQHLTIENMAENFIFGVNSILGLHTFDNTSNRFQQRGHP